MSRDDMGRTSRSAPPAAPIGSSVAVVVTLLALVLGFLILRQVNSDPATVSPAGDDTETTSTSIAGGLPLVTSEPTTPATEPMVYSGASVVVANCSSLNQVAGQLSLALGGLGFSMAEATNGTVKLDTSKVLYNPDDPAAQPVANSIAKTLGDRSSKIAVSCLVPGPHREVDAASARLLRQSLPVDRGETRRIDPLIHIVVHKQPITPRRIRHQLP